MLSFEQKKSIFRTYEDLVEKQLSNQRINYEYPKSQQRGKVLATQLHPNGNGYVTGKYMNSETVKEKGYKLDSRGWINIKEFSESELHEVIVLTMLSMNQSKPIVRKKLLITENYSPQRIVAQRIPEKLVRSCLSNWLGYGDLKAPTWFLEMEEAGDEIWGKQAKTLEESLKLRSNFHLQMDLRHVWEELYQIPMETCKGAKIWEYMAAYLLEFSGENATTDRIDHFLYQKKMLGRERANHFIAKFRPLPKKMKSSIEPYQSIWGKVESYEEEIEADRIDLIKENLFNHDNVKLLITYERDLTEKLLQSFSDRVKKISIWQLNREKYSLYQIKLSDERNVLLLSTPFFSEEQSSYKGIKDGIKRLNRIKTWAL